MIRHAMMNEIRIKRLQELELRSQYLLHRVRWPSGRRCSGRSDDEPCGSRSYRKIVRKGRGGMPIVSYQCRRCGRQYRSTSDTMFEGTRLPLYLWFVVLGFPFRSYTAKELAERLRIPYRQAWTLVTNIKYRFKYSDIPAKLRNHPNSLDRIAWDYWEISRPKLRSPQREVQLKLQQLTESGMSQRAIAKKLNCSQYAIHSWLRGKFRPILSFDYRLRDIRPRRRRPLLGSTANVSTDTK
jgi:hypothetical protein